MAAAANRSTILGLAMTATSDLAVVERLVEAIGRHDVAEILELLTDESVLIDSAGAVLRGRAELERAWRGYFELFPDYRIEIEARSAAGSTVALFGIASGSAAVAGSDERRAWRTPAAWRAEVRGDRIAVWQVYADLAPVRAAMGGEA